MDIDQTEEIEPTIAEPSVVDKYKAAAEVANNVLNQLIQEAQPGKLIVELCALGDKLIEEATAKLYNKVKTEKGIAFPTCVSLNNCVGHFSPLVSEDKTALKKDDIVKIDLGVHIDGFISTAAHTFVCAGDTETPLAGRAADVICAAYFAAECVHRLIRPGKTNKECTDIIQKVAEVFKCQAVEGVLSHEMKRFVIDGNKTIIARPELDQQVEDVTFETNEVYSVDIVMSTGEGKPREGEARTTVFKRAIDQNYNLKSKHSRAVLNSISKKFSTMPFNLRSVGTNENEARFGIVELVNHDMVSPYPVLYEKDGEIVAQFKYTVLVLPNSTLRLNSFAAPFVSSTYSIDGNEEIGKVMAMSTKRNKKGKKKAKAPAADAKKEDKMDTSS